MTTLAAETKAMRLPNLEQNIKHCWRCSHCKWTPSPKSHAFAHACPSIEYGGFHSYSGGGKVITAYALRAGEATLTPLVKDSIYACTMCGACDTGCKNNNGELVEPLNILYALRAHVVDQGEALPEHEALVRNMQAHGNAAGEPKALRSQWADGLDLTDATNTQVDVLLHIGCENAYDRRQWLELRAIVTLLRRAGVQFGIAYNDECATGEIAYDLGFQKDALALAQAAAAVIDRTGTRTVVTCSASSYHAFVNIWPRMGLICDVEVKHISDFIDMLVEQGKLAIGGTFAQRVTYHDPCKLGRLGERFIPTDGKWTRILQTVSAYDRPTHTLFGNGGVYEAPRTLLQRLSGLSLVEMERNRVGAYCCGAGGGAKQANPEFAFAAANKRLDEAEATGASVLATSCAGCRQHLGEAAAKGSRIQVMSVFEILAAAAGDTP